MLDYFIKLLSALAIPFFMTGIIISLLVALIFGHYNIMQNSISELGTRACSPIPQLFNYTFMISSFLFFFFFLICGMFAMDAYKGKTISITIATILLMTSSVGIFGVGYFNLDKDPVMHTISAIVTFSTLGLGELIMGILQAEYNGNKCGSMYLLIIFVVIAVLFIIFRTAIFEWLFFVAIIYWGFPMVWKILMCLLSG